MARRKRYKIIARTCPIEGYVTLDEIAAKFGRTHSTVFKWVKAGYFPDVLVINRQALVPKRAVDEFVMPPLGNPVHRKQKDAVHPWEEFLERRRSGMVKQVKDEARKKIRRLVGIRVDTTKT